MLTSLTIGRWLRHAGACAGVCLAASSMATAAPPGEQRAAGAREGQDWVIEIRPLQIGPPEIRAAAPGRGGPTAPAAGPYAPEAAASGLTPLMSYSQAYVAVPFNREEYEANPGYRHDAAMELMFGTLRPTTIFKQNVPYFSRYPDFFRNRFQIYPYPNGGGQQSLNMYWLWSTNAITW